ncbi:leukocyte cysteine proteinase inhibitor 1-like [Aythya fuligula]|uniref:Leukocyte cysteine proteinase inhibitor 1-like n=1 Tax=Aythya fuligula TaxID=219594 RepID=A0A6J3DCL7_AYTFU|nr:leukocyte cysteine proteinase inhibitor 1-like [Aythya fuligula]
MVLGGLSETKPATSEIQHIADQVKAEFERRAKITCDIFQAIVYRDQLVAGKNYFIKEILCNCVGNLCESFVERKVQISDTGYVHLMVFLALPYEEKDPVLIRYEIPKTRDDPVTPF